MGPAALTRPSWLGRGQGGAGPARPGAQPPSKACTCAFRVPGVARCDLVLPTCVWEAGGLTSKTTDLSPYPPLRWPPRPWPGHSGAFWSHCPRLLHPQWKASCCSLCAREGYALLQRAAEPPHACTRHHTRAALGCDIRRLIVPVSWERDGKLGGGPGRPLLPQLGF